jgi:16S rRNA G966 N2-methylase RsmD
MIDKFKTYIALMTFKDQPYHFSWNGPTYLFTTENISGYLNQIPNIQGQNILSVCSSGDHAFECLLRGAKRVDVFDINYLQKYILELKNKMIQKLEYQDFYTFFFDKKNFLNKDIIRPIFDDFSEGLQVYLDTYYQHDIYNQMFRISGLKNNKKPLLTPSYVSDQKKYEELQKLVPDNFNFIRCDIKDLRKKTRKKYSLILLSNIFGFQYQHIADTQQSTNMFYNDILKPLGQKNLNDDGIICWNYVWDIDNKRPRKTNISTDNGYVHHFSHIPITSAIQDKTAQKTDIVFLMTKQKSK